MAGILGSYVNPSRTGVSESVINSGSVLSGALGDSVVYSGNIASGQIGSFHLSSGSVVSGRIASGNLFTLQVASGGFLSGAIGSGIIGWNHLTADIKAGQADMEAGTSVSGFVTPLNTVFHPGVAKSWVNFTANAAGVSGTIAVLSSFGVGSITDAGVGLFTINWSSGFTASGSSAVVGICSNDSVSSRYVQIAGATLLAANSPLSTVVGATGAAVDPTTVCVVAFGDKP